MKLTFYGGAGHVTGSRFALSDEQAGTILVDCGMRQGADAEQANREPFGFDPKSITAVVITHAHLDHIGLLPRLAKEGYRGPVYMTPPTRDLGRLMLEDAQGIMALHASTQGTSIIYEKADIDIALSLVKPIGYGESVSFEGGLSMVLKNAGHILGSAMARFDKGGRSILFTGDLGHVPSALVPDNDPVADAEYLVMESVYGDRKHGDAEHRRKELQAAIQETAARSGVLLIPAFSLERSQIVLQEIHELMEAGGAPRMSVFLDSPLAIRVTEVYERYPEFLNEKMRAASGKRLFDFPMLTRSLSSEDSQGVEDAANPKIIIAGAGMSHGGRIRRHEMRYLPEKSTLLLLVGYQVPGSLGRALQDGDTKVRIDKYDVKVRAQIRSISGYSAHKDTDQLVDFVATGTKNLKKVFVTMGEPKASAFLAQRLKNELGVTAVVPTAGSSESLL